jgi:hypothetical protein
MAWTDAARRAAAEAKRRHAKATTWYHGTDVVRGTKLKNTVGEYLGGRYSEGGTSYEGGGKLRKTASASNSVKEARSYGATLYKVTLPKAQSAYRIQKSRLGWVRKEFKDFREASAISPTVKRLPTAKGKAARGKY